MKTKISYFLIALIAVSLKVHSQDNCVQVLLLASRDVESSKQKAAVAQMIYEMKSSQYSSSAEASAGIDKIGFSGSFSKNDIENISSTNINDLTKDIINDQKSSIIVREAIDAWLECKRLSNNGVIIRPQVLDESFTIDFIRESRDVIIEGVNYNPKNCECSARVNGTTPEVVDENTTYTIDDPTAFNITCKRIGVQKESGIEYSSIEFIVPTSEGVFTMRIPSRIKPNHEWLHQVDSSLSQLSNKIESLSSSTNAGFDELEKFKNRIDDIKIYSGHLKPGVKSDRWKRGSSTNKTYSKKINFPKNTFEKEPKVICNYRLLDIDHNDNTRIEVYATGISKTGFTLNVRTWGRTYVHNIMANYIAYTNY